MLLYDRLRKRSFLATAFVLTDTFLFIIRRYFLNSSATFITSILSDMKKSLRRFPPRTCNLINFRFLNFWCIAVVAHSIASIASEMTL